MNRKQVATAVAVAAVIAAIAFTGGGAARIGREAATSVTYVSSASWSVYGKNDSRSFTVPDSSSSKALLFVFAGKLGGDGITAASYGGQPLTRLVSSGQGSARIEVWYLLAPPEGTATFSWSKSGASQNVTWGLSVFAGVDQSTPFTDVKQAGATQDPSRSGKSLATFDLYPPTGAVILDAAVFNGGPTGGGPTADAGQTSLWSRSMSTTQGGAAIVPGNPVQVAWTPQGSPSYDWAIVAVGIRPIADGSGIPENTSPPTVTSPSLGTFTVGSNGVWTNSPSSYDYQWLTCPVDVPVLERCRPIPDATGSSFTVPVDVTPFEGALRVTARNSIGSAVAFSDFFSVARGPMVLEQPVVSGPPKVGATLTSTIGFVSDPDIEGQYGILVAWLRCGPSGFSCQPIPNASGMSYTVVAADTGLTIRSVVTQQHVPNTGGLQIPVASLPTPVIQP